MFTIPELVRVGMLEHEAKESGLDVDVRFTHTSGWFSNYRISEMTGATKILVDKSTDRIISAHLLGHDYAEFANTIALAVKNGLTTRQIKSTTAAHPVDRVGSGVDGLTW